MRSKGISVIGYLLEITSNILFSFSSSPSLFTSSPSLTMSSSILRLSRLHRAASCSFSLSCSNHPRRAMMSALRTNNTHPLSSLSDSPPIVIPDAASIPSDAAAPQTAARPPPVPKAEKPRPKIKATKAALTMVRSFSHVALVYSSAPILDSARCFSNKCIAQWTNTPAHSHRCAEQGLCWALIPS